MCKENISQEFRFINIEEIRNYFIKEIGQNELWVRSTKRFVRLLITLTNFLF